MLTAMAVALAIVGLFAFPAFVFVASKLISRRGKTDRPEPPQPNRPRRNIPGGNSGKTD